ncbi:putative small auxin-up RNA [Helianthus anomalus]
MMMQVKIVKSWLKKRRHTNVARWLSCENLCPLTIRRTSSSSCMHDDDDDGDDDEDYIPRDVPKGHLAVYVGENQSRFVINVKLLKYPLFNALLDQAREEYEFTAGCRLYIPCHEDVFLSVVRCAAIPKDRRFTFCL